MSERVRDRARVAVRTERPSLRRAAAFLEAVQRSRALHGRWVRPPATLAEYRDFLRRVRRPTHLSYFVCTEDGALAGVVNISEIVRGSFCSGYLGYYALAPHQGHGYVREGLRAVVREAFRSHGLHRLEANIQPENLRSIALVRSLGFRKEGYSPRYLKIGGRWRDHERWALTAEDRARALRT
jgi:[ribosomal protein S5]-alanine N-acetyltransferase